MRGALSLRAGEQALRPHQKDQEQQHEGDRVLPFGRDLPQAETFDQPDQVAAENGPGDRAQPAHHGNDEGHENRIEAHRRCGAFVEQREYRGHRRYRGPQREYHQRDAVGVDADDACHVAIVAKCEDRLAVARLSQEQQQRAGDGQQRDRLGDLQASNENRTQDEDWRREAGNGVDARSERQRQQAFEDNGKPERQDQHAV